MRLDSAQVVIIGGGCSGASAAYHLCKAGITNVALVEKSFMASGATGRCGGGMRAQWSTPGNVQLAAQSIGFFKTFKDEIGQDIDFLEGGYVLPAFNEKMIGEFKQNIALQNKYGVPSRLVTVKELKDIVPLLDLEAQGVIAAAYCPTDGKSNPFLVVKGWADRAKQMGARFHTFTNVKALQHKENKITAVVTDKGTISADWVINCAGPNAPDIAGMAGVEVPITPFRHQILVTEPVEACFNPMVIDLKNNIYFSQSKHGSFIMGQTDRDEVPGFNEKEHWRFQVEIARKITAWAPRLKKLNILRQWAGHYDMSPDRQCILGKFSDYDNFLIAAGFSGHGFMFSPSTGRILADIITKGRTSVDLTDYSMERFRREGFTVERNVV